MSQHKRHWVVELDRRNRTISFAITFIIIGTLLWQRQQGPLAWVSLAASLLVYPQLAYLHARRAADPIAAEMRNLLFDGVMFGAWIVVLGMPLWISFMLVISCCVNLMLFQGLPGTLKIFVALALGGGLAWITGAFPGFRPETSLLTSLLCIGLMALYLLVIAQGAHASGLRLRDSKRQMREQLVQISQLQERLREQAERDPLTGLSNRRHLDRILTEALQRTDASGVALAVMMIDIDHFKQINDTHGHAAGDQVLREVAVLLRRHAGTDGVAARYGGEEFVLALPGYSQADALRLAQTICGEFEALQMLAGDQVLRATLSMGVAATPGHGTDREHLLRMADGALYAAKTGGRNRVVAAAIPEADCATA